MKIIRAFRALRILRLLRLLKLQRLVNIVYDFISSDWGWQKMIGKKTRFVFEEWENNWKTNNWENGLVAPAGGFCRLPWARWSCDVFFMCALGLNQLDASLTKVEDVVFGHIVSWLNPVHCYCLQRFANGEMFLLFKSRPHSFKINGFVQKNDHSNIQ